MEHTRMEDKTQSMEHGHTPARMNPDILNLWHVRRHASNNWKHNELPKKQQGLCKTIWFVSSPIDEGFNAMHVISCGGKDRWASCATAPCHPSAGCRFFANQIPKYTQCIEAQSVAPIYGEISSRVFGSGLSTLVKGEQRRQLFEEA